MRGFSCEFYERCNLTQHRYFPVKFANFLKTFFQRTPPVAAFAYYLKLNGASKSSRHEIRYKYCGLQNYF